MNMSRTVAVSNIVTAFSAITVGTKVRAGMEGIFWREVEAAVAKHDFSAESTPGQAFLSLSPDATYCVSAGVGKRTTNEEDYIARAHRGQVGLFLKRSKAASTEKVAVIVYTKAAYLADPDVQKNADELARAEASDKDFFLVAVLAFAGPKSQHSPFRFAANLAGGNNDALTMSADEIRAWAKDVVAYDLEWCVVAD